jgi:hypothetical protein
MSESESDLESLDPEAETCFDGLCACISEELAARIAVGADATSSAGPTTLSELIADAILDAFVVRARATPRYRWLQPQ